MKQYLVTYTRNGKVYSETVEMSNMQAVLRWMIEDVIYNDIISITQIFES